MPVNASFHGKFAEVSFDTSDRNQLSCFQNDFFLKFFGAFMIHKIRQNAGKKIKVFSELFINNIFEYTFVSFEHNQTISRVD